METRTRLYLARHGETTASAEFRYIGQTDVDITGNGVEQMERIKQRLRDEEILAFFSSDLIRARKGAEIIASCHGIEPVSSPEFREINLGIWEGMTQEEIMERYPEEYTARLQGPSPDKRVRKLLPGAFGEQNVDDAGVAPEHGAEGEGFDSVLGERAS